MFDYLIVGAGLAGSVLAERLASQLNYRVLIVDKRDHIGGNAYDYYDDNGIFLHKYGPHIFHTNIAPVYHYLSEFTKWRMYEHRVLAAVDGMMVPIPINMDTLNRLFGLALHSPEEVESYYASIRVPIAQPGNAEEQVLSKVGQVLYEKFFKGYSLKQWGIHPREMDAAVTARIPIRTNRDDRYFSDQYQVMPLHGYSRMFQSMLANPNISIMLNTNYRDIREVIPHKALIFTGPIDEFFDYRFGRLPYRSLEFVHEYCHKPYYQTVGTVNYPNEFDFTRVTEFKHLTGQRSDGTTVVYEYPLDMDDSHDPYYPIPRKENALLYDKYQVEAEQLSNVTFCGRLAEYKYYNMDQVVERALAVFENIACNKERE